MFLGRDPSTRLRRQVFVSFRIQKDCTYAKRCLHRYLTHSWVESLISAGLRNVWSMLLTAELHILPTSHTNASHTEPHIITPTNFTPPDARRRMMTRRMKVMQRMSRMLITSAMTMTRGWIRQSWLFRSSSLFQVLSDRRPWLQSNLYKCISLSAYPVTVHHHNQLMSYIVSTSTLGLTT